MIDTYKNLSLYGSQTSCRLADFFVHLKYKVHTIFCEFPLRDKGRPITHRNRKQNYIISGYNSRKGWLETV